MRPKTEIDSDDSSRQSHTTQSDDQENGTCTTWEKLMGDDIVMSLTNNHRLYGQTSEGVGEKGESNGDTYLMKIIPEIQVDQGEIGDYILVDYDGYCDSSNDATRRITEQLTKSETEAISISNSTTIQPFIQARDWLITLGNGDVLPGLEMSIRFLKSQECGIVKCHSKYAYGPCGRKGQHSSKNDTMKDNSDAIHAIPEVPPNTNIIYKIKIKKVFSQQDEQTSTNSFKIQLFQQMKKIGNHYYKNDWITPPSTSPKNGQANNTNNAIVVGGNGKQYAMKLYNAIAQNAHTLLQELDHGTIERRNVFHIVIDAMNNISAVHLREKEYRKALDASNKALQLDPYNMKALCRGAKAALMIGEFDKCKELLETAGDIVENVRPDDKETKFYKTDIQRLKRELTQKRREQKKLEREIYSQMLSGKKAKSAKNAKKSSKKITMNHNVQNDDKDQKVHEQEALENDVRQTIFTKLAVYFLIPVVAAMLWSLVNSQQ